MGKILAISFPIFLSLFLLIPAEVSGEDAYISGINDKINSIVHYAEEYEVGNINYLQLNVYGHKIRADLNLLLGGSIGKEWARIPQENIEKTFGQPAEYTNWIWVDNMHLHKRLDDKMPRWERIIFDGRKVQIIFNAFPSAIEDENGGLFRYYSVDLDVRFKKKFNIDIDSIFSEINSLAYDFNLTRTTKSGKALMTRAIEYERVINGYVEENMGRCTAIIDGFFEPEEKWPEQKMVMWRLNLYEGKDFDLMLQFEECNDCGEGKWIYMWTAVEGIGPMFIFSSPELHLGKLRQQIDVEYYRTLSVDELNQELKKTFLEMRDDAEKFDKTRSEDFPKRLYLNKFRIQEISMVQDEKYNNVYEFDMGIARRIASGELQGPGGCENLVSCRRYCEENREECISFMHGLRVEFLDNILRDYEIEKTSLARFSWERTLIENSETRKDNWCMHVNDLQCRDDEGCADGMCVPALGGNETCDNMADDDGDNVVDCQDPDCWEERHCGKLCEDICNREGGCWQTIHDTCYDDCKECWDCGGSEDCSSVCEPACWPCQEKEEIKNACDDCWLCEDEAYGGCYGECKPCDECNARRKEKIRVIFDRAATGEIETPGGCMTEDDCNSYCAEHGEECGGIMAEIGFYSEELECSEECRECTICNYDLGNFRCSKNQYLDRNSGFCVCEEGWYDCDGDWRNGCETNSPCFAGPCFEECLECDACEGDCNETCLGCYKCRNPGIPTYICDGVERLEPCEVEYVCNGVKQKKPCKTYICNGREYTRPCDEINITCGLNQVLDGNRCVCREGFKDCDNDGNCESTRACGLEICDDNKDNNNDSYIDCQDKKCDQQFCRIENGTEFFCIEKRCADPNETIPPEPQAVCGNHACEEGEDNETCPEDCVVCETFEPPECPNGKIVWGGKDKYGCHLPPICVVTEKACETDEDCPDPKCGISRCIENECKVTELITDCEEGCKEGKTKKRKCRDGSEIITAVCSANEWVETGNDCPEVPKDCIREGEAYMPGGDRQCCPGLKGISASVGDGRTCSLTAGHYCTACGNGKCEGMESACNCPEDCPCPEGRTYPYICNVPYVTGPGVVSEIPWCECISGKWDCIASPEDQCPAACGDDRCEADEHDAGPAPCVADCGVDCNDDGRREAWQCEEYCIEVITPAMDDAGNCGHFATPCDVPSGWKTVDECPEEEIPPEVPPEETPPEEPPENETEPEVPPEETPPEEPPEEGEAEPEEETPPDEEAPEAEPPEGETEPEEVPEVEPEEEEPPEEGEAEPEEETPPDEEAPEAEPPEGETEPEEEEEIAPEVEEEDLEVCEDCILAEDCGGSQDVCSNGNCVTLPIPAEEPEKKSKEKQKEKQKGPEAEPGEPSPQEAPSEEPEEAPEPEEEETPQEEAPETEPDEPEPETEEPSEEPESPPEEEPVTGGIAGFMDYMTGLFTGLFAEESPAYPCSDKCRSCDKCNQQVERIMSRILAGEIQGVGGCRTRMECENYCYQDENEQECESFLAANGLQTIDCWEFCVECSICRFETGELQCQQNQYFDTEYGYCMCNKGWYECDGDWETGCESPKRCGTCESKEDCAGDRCAPWGNVVQQFDCIEGEEWVEQGGIFFAQGACHIIPGNYMRSWGGVYFEGGGKPFDDLRAIREEISLEMGEQSCGWQLDSLIKERLELQNSITTDFLEWFFEEYVPSSPSEWEKHIGGIYDSYWRFVNNNERTVEMLLCLGSNRLPEEYVPIDISYDTDYGSVRIWEVETTTDFYGKRTRIISTYMRIWVFPPKEFIKKEFQDAMKLGMIPTPEGNKEPEPSPSDIEEAKKNKELMDTINSISGKYGGEAKLLFSIVDKDELVFNALVTISPDIAIKVEPMETYYGDYDAKITVEFDFFYSIMETTEKEIRGGQTEYPPWEREGLKLGDAIKGVVDGIRMWFLMNSGVFGGSITSDPPDALGDGLAVMRYIFERGPAAPGDQGGKGNEGPKGSEGARGVGGSEVAQGVQGSEGARGVG